MNPLTDHTRRRLFAIMREIGVDQEERAEWLESMTYARFSSMKELPETVALDIISRLAKAKSMRLEARKRMGRKIIAMLAQELGWIQGDKPDYARINNLMQNKSPSRKPLWELPYEEMVKMVNMVEEIVKKERR